MIYGWDLGKSPNKDLVVGSFKIAVRRLKRFGIRVFKRIIIRQDRGGYTSSDYASEALSKGFYLSYSRTGEHGDNVVNEAFFSRFKEEWRDVLEQATDFEELRRLVKKAVSYHNESSRYHSSISYETPQSFMKQQIKLLTQVLL